MEKTKQNTVAKDAIWLFEDVFAGTDLMLDETEIAAASAGHTPPHFSRKFTHNVMTRKH